MCGIAGYQGRFSAALLTSMSAALAHRGPDGEGEAVLGRDRDGYAVGLVHRRLAIIDLSANGAQPMTVQCRLCNSHSLEDLALTYNGEIYNFQELRHQLIDAGHTFRSQTDSEVLLHLYAELGPSMLSRLNGIFAFAIYDGREAGRSAEIREGDLWIVRDQLGVKPLYYTEASSGFVFASELKALLACSQISREIDPVALQQYLAYLWTPAPRTMLRSVRKLAPGHALIVRKGYVAREWSYYDLPYGDAPLADSKDVIAREVHSLVARAVDRQMVADVPVGALLSGGLDSSAVVAMMRRSRPDHRPVCYTIGFAGETPFEGGPSDLPFAHRVAAHLDVELRPIILDSSSAVHLERVLHALDEPVADPAPINSLLIAEHARRDGIKVLLSGAGGDDIFSGYRRHAVIAYRSRRGSPPAPVWAAAGGFAAAAARLAPRNRVLRRAAREFTRPSHTSDAWIVSYFQHGDSGLRQSLYARELSDVLQGHDPNAPLIESLQRIPKEDNVLNRMLYLEAKHFLGDHNLNYVDKTGMAAGVEIRVPLLDIDLIAYATRIPANLKQRGRSGKWIFKRAMEPDLPHEIIHREKSGFGAPLRYWLRNELRDFVSDTLSATTLRERGLFEPAAVNRVIDLDRRGMIDGTYTIFALLCFELWCRSYIDNSPEHASCP